MADTKTVKGRLQIQVHPLSDLETINPIPLRGELFVALETREMRIGDGVTRWADLLPTRSGVFTPSINASTGVLSWTNNLGLPNPDPIVVIGKDGVAGAPGTPGTDGKSAYEYAEDAGYTGTETQFSNDLNKINSHGQQHRSTGIDPIAQHGITIILASGWSNGEYIINDTIIEPDSDGNVYISQSATKDQYIAWASAMPQIVSQGSETLTIRANGEVPTTNIPVNLEVR